jgi:hypothetical protein
MSGPRLSISKGQMCWPILVETSLMLSFVRTVRDEAGGSSVGLLKAYLFVI